MAVKLAVSVALLAFLFSRIDRRGCGPARASASLAVAARRARACTSSTCVASTWRWHLLLDAQDVHVRRRSLLGSFLVALFFNNFLPSNIGGDVIRIRDTAQTGAVENAGDDRRARGSRRSG